MDNPEEIELGEDEDLCEDDVPDDADPAELEAETDDGAYAPAAANGVNSGVSHASAGGFAQQQGAAVRSRPNLQASLAAVQPAGGGNSQVLGLPEPAVGAVVNPEDIDLPDD